MARACPDVIPGFAQSLRDFNRFSHVLFLFFVCFQSRHYSTTAIREIQNLRIWCGSQAQIAVYFLAKTPSVPQLTKIRSIGVFFKKSNDCLSTPLRHRQPHFFSEPMKPPDGGGFREASSDCCLVWCCCTCQNYDLKKKTDSGFAWILTKPRSKTWMLKTTKLYGWTSGTAICS